ncbi:MAG: hypothetical protein K1Y36_21945 [Blastocatellia bacterium]|nr:hypothetical protein [Blastocatellia bacterium]
MSGEVLQNYPNRLLAWVNHLHAQMEKGRLLRIVVSGPQRQSAIEDLVNHPLIEILEGDTDAWMAHLLELEEQQAPIIVFSTGNVQVAEHFFSQVADWSNAVRAAVWVGRSLQRPLYPINSDETWQFQLNAYERKMNFLNCQTQTQAGPVFRRLNSSRFRFTPGLILDPVNERQLNCLERLVREIEAYETNFVIPEPECRSDAGELVQKLVRKIQTLEKLHPKSEEGS